MSIELKVATINLHNRADRWLERRHLLVSQLIEIVPDLIALQELNVPIRQGQWLCKQVNYRLSGSGKVPYVFVQKRFQHLLHGALQAVGILSRLPILYHESINLGYGGRVALRAHLELPSHQTMDFVSTQLHDVSFEREAREEQAMKLVGWLNSHKHVPIQVMAGDFNETPAGLAVAYIKQSFRSAYEERHGHEPLATFPTYLTPTDAPAACLDYIFFSAAVHKITHARLFANVAAREDDTLYPSDHVGLVATLEV
jgi:endonuclease/exonuclease/phosphatase family metal-dependent hydrolase